MVDGVPDTLLSPPATPTHHALLILSPYISQLVCFPSPSPPWFKLLYLCLPSSVSPGNDSCQGHRGGGCCRTRFNACVQCSPRVGPQQHGTLLSIPFLKLISSDCSLAEMGPRARLDWDNGTKLTGLPTSILVSLQLRATHQTDQSLQNAYLIL